jgi:hypothetical protein
LKNIRYIFAGLAAAGLAACTAGQTGPPDIKGVNPLAISSLQFAVGTANIGGVATGMNVLVTMRQANGQSAVLVNTPALSGPFTLPAGTAVSDANGSTVVSGNAPSTNETGTAPTPVGCPVTACIAGTPQQTPGTPLASFPYLSSFGTSGGAFGIGFAPANYTANGAPNSLTPYRIPMYAIPGGFSSITPWGGPPAYDPTGNGRGTRDGTFPAGVLGVALGTSVFSGANPGVGTYTMNVAIPSTGSTGTVTATSTLAAVTPLATIAPPTLVSSTVGGGPFTIAYVLPGGITGAYVTILNRGGGGCSGTQISSPTAWYTFWVTASGTVTVNNANAPTTTTAGVFPVAACTGDLIRAWVIGFDYNHYALSYNGPLGSTYPQTPALPAKADISISQALNFASL